MSESTNDVHFIIFNQSFCCTVQFCPVLKPLMHSSRENEEVYPSSCSSMLSLNILVAGALQLIGEDFLCLKMF